MSLGASGNDWRARAYAENARFVSDLGGPVLDLLGPRAGERILDLGCGDGALTERLTGAGAEVVAIDASADMVESARRRGLDARVLDATALSFEDEFDAVFSNAVLHWIPDADTVIRGVSRALRPGGRFVGEFGGHGNVAAFSVAVIAVLDRYGVDAAASHPWYNPTPAEYTRRLEAHDFAVESMDLIPRPTPLPTGIEGWMDTFTDFFFEPLSPVDRKTARQQVIDLLATQLRDSEGVWTADYVRLRFSARKAA